MKRIIDLPRVVRSGIDEGDIATRISSFDEAANTIEVVFTTGATVRRYNWVSDGYVDEQLVVAPSAVRLDRLNAGAPFLASHDRWSLSSVIGVVVRGSARIVAGKGIATIQLSRAADDAAIVQKIRDGLISNISAGYRIHKIVKSETNEGTVPLWRVTDWEPEELSAVTVPADPGAQVRSSDSGRPGLDVPHFRAEIDIPDDQTALARIRTRMAAAAAGAATP